MSNNSLVVGIGNVNSGNEVEQNHSDIVLEEPTNGDLDMQSIFEAKDIEKPCHLCGFCPYGVLVEDYPIFKIEEKYAREHDMWARLSPSQGWEKCSKDDPGAIPDINSVIGLVENPYSCSWFGHDCPVYYLAEGFVDDR